MKLFNNTDRIKRLEEAASVRDPSVYFADLENGKYTVYSHSFPKKVFTEKEFRKFSDRIAETEPMSVILVDDIQFWNED